MEAAAAPGRVWFSADGDETGQRYSGGARRSIRLDLNIALERRGCLAPPSTATKDPPQGVLGRLPNRWTVLWGNSAVILSLSWAGNCEAHGSGAPTLYYQCSFMAKQQKLPKKLEIDLEKNKNIMQPFCTLRLFKRKTSYFLKTYLRINTPKKWFFPRRKKSYLNISYFAKLFIFYFVAALNKYQSKNMRATFLTVLQKNDSRLTAASLWHHKGPSFLHLFSSTDYCEKLPVKEAPASRSTFEDFLGRVLICWRLLTECSCECDDMRVEQQT